VVASIARLTVGVGSSSRIKAVTVDGLEMVLVPETSVMLTTTDSSGSSRSSSIAVSVTLADVSPAVMVMTVPEAV
jgi:hypothetical protein